MPAAPSLSIADLESLASPGVGSLSDRQYAILNGSGSVADQELSIFGKIGAGAVVWTPIASLTGGFLNGWTPDATNVPKIGLVTVGGLALAVVKGLIKATAGAGPSAIFVLPAGYRQDVATGLGANTYQFFNWSSEATGTNTNTIILEGASSTWNVVGGYDGAGNAFTAGNCKDILLDYAWRVNS